MSHFRTLNFPNQVNVDMYCITSSNIIGTRKKPYLPMPWYFCRFLELSAQSHLGCRYVRETSLEYVLQHKLVFSMGIAYCGMFIMISAE